MKRAAVGIVTCCVVVGCGEELEQDGEQPTPGAQVELEAACTMMARAATTVSAAAEPAEAPVIVPLPKPYAIELPAESAAFVTLHVIADHSDIMLHGSPGAGLEAVHQDGAVVEALGAGRANAVCAQDVDVMHSWHVHSQGMYLLEFAPGASRRAKVLFAASASAHSDHGHSH